MWPSVRIVHDRSRRPPGETSFGPDRAVVELGGGEGVLLDRQSASATFVGGAPADDGRLIHPLLATVGAIFAWWRGQAVFHGGAFMTDGGAWAILGRRGSGKSSVLAGLAVAGVDVIADDVVVVSDRLVLTGPRCVDLRDEAARLLELDESTDVVRAGQRRRLRLGPMRPEVRLRGWIFLSWGPEVMLHRLDAAARLQGLASNLVGHPATGLLELGSLPAWRLTRPREWESFQPTVERLLRIDGA
jgi:hypothetical protein